MLPSMTNPTAYIGFSSLPNNYSFSQITLLLSLLSARKYYQTTLNNMIYHILIFLFGSQTALDHNMQKTIK
jgi:hypothetical protein